MKIKKLFTILVFMAMSLSVLHALVIDELDTHSCSTTEYIQEFSHHTNTTTSGDICSIHSAFHLPIIISDSTPIFKKIYAYDKPQTTQKKYEYNSYDNFLKPPITL